jgi:hypothetical protein
MANEGYAEIQSLPKNAWTCDCSIYIYIPDTTLSDILLRFFYWILELYQPFYILTLLMIQDVCFGGIAALNIYNKQLSIPFSPRMICSIELIFLFYLADFSYRKWLNSENFAPVSTLPPYISSRLLSDLNIAPYLKDVRCVNNDHQIADDLYRGWNNGMIMMYTTFVIVLKDCFFIYRTQL